MRLSRTRLVITDVVLVKRQKKDVHAPHALLSRMIKCQAAK